MTYATISGYPRIGTRRALKWALEGYWSGRRTAEDLDTVARDIRRASWSHQLSSGVDLIPVNDFSLYDGMLDMSIMLGVIPERFGWDGGTISHDLRFAMARGTTGPDGVAALELTKWFDTNYHYLVPELAPDQMFQISDDKPLRELAEFSAVAPSIPARVVLIGPITYLLLAKRTDDGPTLDLLPAILPAYEQIVRDLAEAGAAWIAFDEPALVSDRSAVEIAALRDAYQRLAKASGETCLLVQTAFGDPVESLRALAELPIDGIGVDLTRGLDLLDRIERDGLPSEALIFAGVVDGRNVWVNDLSRSLSTLRRLESVVGTDRVHVSSSCSLLHVPLDLFAETALPEGVGPWLAFANQKLVELTTLKRGFMQGDQAITSALEANQRVLGDAASSTSRTRESVRRRATDLSEGRDRRNTTYAERARIQADRLDLPLLPTTTIGSFPQTPEIRGHRRRYEQGELGREEYEQFLGDEIRTVIRRQEEVGLDVLVHGEPERNDMVQYFGEQLEGFAFTREGWVQSYGSRCVRPPIIFGDVERPAPMTVRWATFAQSLTAKPVKGMLTGPVTILNWSFVRDDQPRAATCLQIALAIQDEVRDLEAAGIAIIQIDEPALREGLPLRRAGWDEYLTWATRAFRVASADAHPGTQIHTHMCYSEFSEIIDAIEALDADVISIENARSGQELLNVFRHHGYDKGIGPGVYDIHSPAVPDTTVITDRLWAITTVLPTERVWVNPDCGLKTRNDDEVWPSLQHMVEAAERLRRAKIVHAK